MSNQVTIKLILTTFLFVLLTSCGGIRVTPDAENKPLDTLAILENVGWDKGYDIFGIDGVPRGLGSPSEYYLTTGEHIVHLSFFNYYKGNLYLKFTAEANKRYIINVDIGQMSWRANISEKETKNIVSISASKSDWDRFKK